MIEAGRYDDAYVHYAKMLELFPRDTDALVNYGLLAARLGHPDVAIDAWGRAADTAPDQPNPHLYLAEAYDRRQEPASAARHWEAYLKLATAHPGDSATSLPQRISGAIQLGDDDVRIQRNNAARAAYQSAIDLAQRAGDAKLGSLALAHLANLQEKAGDVKTAAESYQRALALDAKSGDAHSAALDWFNYGQFLRRHQQPGELVYACLLHAETLLAGTSGPDLETVKEVRREAGRGMGVTASAAQKNLPELLARAAALPPDSF
jgi:tetratricopeptide (TPR) repeat protein